MFMVDFNFEISKNKDMLKKITKQTPVNPQPLFNVWLYLFKDFFFKVSIANPS